MQLSAKHLRYWNRNLKITSFLLLVWFFVTFVISYFARGLGDLTLLGFPLSFYMAAQGSLVIYVTIIWYYAHYMDKLDAEYGVDEGEEQ
jgi:putative solute:sodium symporter small subunit